MRNEGILEGHSPEGGFPKTNGPNRNRRANFGKSKKKESSRGGKFGGRGIPEVWETLREKERNWGRSLVWDLEVRKLLEKKASPTDELPNSPKKAKVPHQGGKKVIEGGKRHPAGFLLRR